MLAEVKKRATGADLDTLHTLPENQDKWFELIDGIIYEVIRPSPLHANVGASIVSALLEFVRRLLLGYVFTDGCVYVLPKLSTFIHRTLTAARTSAKSA